MFSPDDLGCDLSTNSSTGQSANSHIHERHDIDLHFRDHDTWYTVKLRPGEMMYIPMTWLYQVCCSPCTDSPQTHTCLHTPSSDTFPTEVMTDNKTSFFYSWWFHVANVKTPQITRYEDFLRKSPSQWSFFVVYYESLKRELKTKSINECRCDERLQTRVEESTHLG